MEYEHDPNEGDFNKGLNDFINYENIIKTQEK